MRLVGTRVQQFLGFPTPYRDDTVVPPPTIPQTIGARYTYH